MISRVAPVVVGVCLLAGCSVAGPVAGPPAAPAAPPVSAGSPVGPGVGSAPVIPEASGLVSLALDNPQRAFTDAVCGEMRLPDTGSRLVVSDPPTQEQRLRAALGDGSVVVSTDGPKWGLDLRSWTRGDVAAAKANSPACRGR